MRVATRSAMAARRRCGRPRSRALADVVQQRATSSRSGRRHLAHQRRGADRRLEQVPVDAEAVHRVALRPVPHRSPLRQQPGDQPGLVERLPDRHQRRPGAEQVDEQRRGVLGHGSGSGGASATRRSTELADSGSPRGRRGRPSAARAAGRSAGRPGPSGRPRRRARPARGRAAAAPACGRGTASARPGDLQCRRQVTSAACVTAAAAAPTSRSRSSASSIPSRATGSCSCCTSTLDGRPVARCSASRTSASTCTASSTSRCGRSATQDAATARRTPGRAGRRGPSLRSGSRSWRRSPCRAPRSSHTSRSSGSRRRAAARQSARTLERSRPTSAGSPATGRASSRPSRTARSALASRRASSKVRTLWSSCTPLSHTGYQTLSARAATPSGRRGRRAAAAGRGRCPATAPPAVAADRDQRDAGRHDAGLRGRPREHLACSQESVSAASPRRRCWPPASAPRAGRAARGAGGVVGGDVPADGVRPQSASTPRSPVRTRTTVSTGVDQTLPSPIRPVCALLTTTSMTSSASASSTRTSMPHLRHQVDGVLRAPVDLGVALLPAVAAGLGHGDAVHAERLQRALHVVELERLDDCGDELHRGLSECDRASCRVGTRHASTFFCARSAPCGAPPRTRVVRRLGVGHEVDTGDLGLRSRRKPIVWSMTVPMR